jgi:HEAT repeat protein
LWYEKVLRKQCKGEVYYVRYADDFLLLFQYENEARQVLGFADDAGKRSFVEEALARHDEAALDAAESILGRRMVDALAAAVPHVGAGQLGLLVRRLVAYGDPVALQAVHDALRRPEELARAQAAEAMAGTTNPMGVRHLATLLKDPSERVVVAAARSLARTPVPGSASALAGCVEQLDVDNKDFGLARELIGCLAQMSDPAAEQALKRLRDRKALIKRGHFADVQRLAGEALAAQAQRRAR